MNKLSHPEEPLENDPGPNDDGFVLGSAGRDEDPNATTDWQDPPKSAEVKIPVDTRGLPGYPGTQTSEALHQPTDPEVADRDETSRQENDGAD